MMKTENKVLIISLIFFAILYTVCKILFGNECAKNMAFGYILTSINFFNMSRRLRKMLSAKVSNFSAFGFIFRFGILASLMILWFKSQSINIPGLLVGISIIPITIPVTAITMSRRKADGTST